MSQQLDFAPLAKILRRRAWQILSTDGEVSKDARDDAELINVLARILEGKPPAKAFGAPGDWGYETPIGSALSDMYRRAL